MVEIDGTDVGPPTQRNFAVVECTCETARVEIVGDTQLRGRGLRGKKTADAFALCDDSRAVVHGALQTVQLRGGRPVIDKLITLCGRFSAGHLRRDRGPIVVILMRLRMELHGR
ncbi:hypothetical protein [Pandoraea commovens]|uniref:Uncharacterized protein n=1 Tax=Pandoraea commovens TaxID=2508289 RepID=A0ABY5Q900_9BURK|nr:hypothetical protein [Pandoraea commovens]UVA77232.1 hypothetical protein NTU39_13960 [Pandoraea commovens]